MTDKEQALDTPREGKTPDTPCAGVHTANKRRHHCWRRRGWM